MTKFESRVKAGGTLIYDPNGIVKHPSRKDINILRVEGSRLAVEMGNPLTFNMIVLGAFLKAKPVIKLENVKRGLEKSLPERHHGLIPLNLEAVNKGYELIESVVQL